MRNFSKPDLWMPDYDLEKKERYHWQRMFCLFSLERIQLQKKDVSPFKWDEKKNKQTTSAKGFLGRISQLRISKKPTNIHHQ